MSDVINLNQQRKAKAKAEKEKQAVQNRVKFGQTKQEKLIEKQRKDKEQKLLDGHKLDKKDPK